MKWIVKHGRSLHGTHLKLSIQYIIYCLIVAPLCLKAFSIVRWWLHLQAIFLPIATALDVA
jgi:hypothetical protein